MQNESVPYYCYILSNKTRTVLYTGVTGRIDIRLAEHRAKIGSAFTYKYNVTVLLWYQVFPDPASAIKAEKQKGLLILGLIFAGLVAFGK